MNTELCVVYLHVYAHVCETELKAMKGSKIDDELNK